MIYILQERFLFLVLEDNVSALRSLITIGGQLKFKYNNIRIRIKFQMVSNAIQKYKERKKAGDRYGWTMSLGDQRVSLRYCYMRRDQSHEKDRDKQRIALDTHTQ